MYHKLLNFVNLHASGLRKRRRKKFATAAENVVKIGEDVRILGAEPTADGGCLIDFYVDFEFRSRFLRGLLGVLFNEAVRHMVGAFEARARQLYGPPAGGPAAAKEAG